MNIRAHHGLLLRAGISPYADAVMSDAPVAYWRLGETSGTVAQNIGSSGINGVYTGGYTQGATSLVTGDANLAVSLNGTTGRVVAGNASQLDYSRNFTLEAIIKPAAIGANRSIISHGIDGFYLRIESTGNLRFIKSQRVVIGDGSAVLVAGNTYHVALTVDAAGNWKIYVDGVLDGSGTTAQTFDASVTGVLIGMEYGTGPGNQEFFTGVIDEVAIYATALSAGRIAAHAALV